MDIVQLTDSFLRRVEELKQMDLRISSRTLLYSAILLRMKSSNILEVDTEEVDTFEPDFPDDPDFPEPEEFPVPKLPVRRISTRPVTLNELILELKKAERNLSRKKGDKGRQAKMACPTHGNERHKSIISPYQNQNIISNMCVVHGHPLKQLP